MGVISRFRNRKSNKEKVQEKEYTSLVATQAGKSLFISFKDRQIVMHSPKAPFITLYRGVFDVVKKGNRATVEDSQKKTIKLVDYSLQEIENGYLIDFFAKGYNVRIQLQEDNNKLTFSTESNNLFEKIKLSFFRNPQEKLIGLGESKSYNLNNATINSYPLSDKPAKITNILNNYFSKSRKANSYLSAIDLLVSSDNYYLITNEWFFQASFEDNYYHITTKQPPKEIIFCFAKSITDLYRNLSEFRPIKQNIPERAQKGFIITESINKLEKTLNLLNTQKIAATITLIKDFNWQIEQLKALEAIAIRYGHRLILRTSPYILLESKDFERYSSQNLLIKNKSGEVYTSRIDGKMQSFIDLTNPLAIKYYKDTLNKALKHRKIIGFCAECEYPLPLDVAYPNEDVRQLRAIWQKLFQKAVYEVTSEKEEHILFFRGIANETSRYGIALTEAKVANDSLQKGLPSVLQSMASLSMSGAGLTITEIGGKNYNYTKQLNESVFKEWAKIGALSPIMLFSAHCTKFLIKNKQFIAKLMSKRASLLPKINIQLQRTQQGLPPMLAEWAIDINSKELDAIYFGDSLKAAYKDNHFIISDKNNDIWSLLLL